MLPRAVPRGDAPKGVRLERHPDVEVPKFVEPSHYGESVGSTGFNVSLVLCAQEVIESKRRCFCFFLDTEMF